jgi:hypothetical protein
MVIPTDSVNGRDGSEKPRVPLALTAATRNWYQCPGRSEFFRVTLVRAVDWCRTTQLLRRAAEKWRPTWCLSSSRKSTGLPCTDGPWGSANHSTNTLRPLRLSVTDRLVGTGGRPAVYPKNVKYTSQQDFVPRNVYCVSNVTFRAESKYAIKFFQSPTVFVQWHLLLLIFRNFSYFLQWFFLHKQIF